MLLDLLVAKRQLKFGPGCVGPQDFLDHFVRGVLLLHVLHGSPAVVVFEPVACYDWRTRCAPLLKNCGVTDIAAMFLSDTFGGENVFFFAAKSMTCPGKDCNYRMTHQVSDYILLTLIWEFHHMPCQFCHICRCPSIIRQTS